MKYSSVGAILRANAALPAAGAEIALTTLPVFDCDRLTLWITYTDAGVAGTGAPVIFPRWQFRAGGWLIATTAQGTMLTGGLLVREALSFAGPGLGATWVRTVELEVPSGALNFLGTIAEIGEIANPGSAGVAGVTSI